MLLLSSQYRCLYTVSLIISNNWGLVIARHAKRETRKRVNPERGARGLQIRSFKYVAKDISWAS